MSVSAQFNETFYLTNNADVVVAISQGTFTSALQHFTLFGGKELRAPNSTFDATYYAVNNPDVLNAVSAGTFSSVFAHYQAFGETENRAPTSTFATFDAAGYLAANADVAAAVTAGTFSSALDHFISFGQNETREGSGVTAVANPGTTFTLTTTSDNLTGTANSDTFNATIDQATAANSTMNAGDVIDGGDGTDVLNVTGVGTTLDVLAAATVTNIETVNIRATTANTLNASQISGLTSVNANQGAGTVLATNLATGASVGVIGNGTIVNGEVAFAYATATDAVTLNISGGTAMTADLTARATLGGTATGTATAATINSTGAANTLTVDLANATLTSVTINAATNLKGDLLSQATDQVGASGAATISGAATSVELTAALDNTLVTIDASGLTAGGLTATLGTGAKTVTGGTGNDIITTAATTATGAAINAGDGTDTLILAATNDVSTSAKAGQYTNFETLRVNNSQDVSLFGSGITSIEAGAMTSKAITGLSAAQAQNITVRGDQTTAVTFALADATGTSDSLGLSLGTGLTNSASTDLNTSLVVTGFENLTLTTNQGPTASTAGSVSTVGAITGATLSNITLKGGGFSIANAATTLKTTIDGSALTGVLTLGGNVIAGSTITGGAGNDLLTAGTNNGSTYNGGDGDDQLSATVAQLTATGSNDTKFVGGDGSDTVKITDAAATVVDTVFNNISGAEKITVDSAGATSFTVSGGFNSAFSGGVAITQAGHTTNGTTATYAMGLSNVDTTIAFTTDNIGLTTEDINITTGSGDDTVTFAGAAFVGVAGADGGQFAISTGAGDDTISVTHATLISNATSITGSVTGGTGADTITKVGTNDNSAFGVTHFNIAAGDSTSTAFDKITGFDVSDGTTGSDGLNFATVAIATVATAVNSGSVLSSSTNAGIVQFDDAETFNTAIVINSTNLADAVGYLAANTATNDVAAFVYDSTGNGTADSTMVYHNDTTDSLVQLTSLTGVDALVTTNTPNANDLFIL